MPGRVSARVERQTVRQDEQQATGRKKAAVPKSNGQSVPKVKKVLSRRSTSTLRRIDSPAASPFTSFRSVLTAPAVLDQLDPDLQDFSPPESPSNFRQPSSDRRSSRVSSRVSSLQRSPLASQNTPLARTPFRKSRQSDDSKQDSSNGKSSRGSIWSSVRRLSSRSREGEVLKASLRGSVTSSSGSLRRLGSAKESIASSTVTLEEELVFAPVGNSVSESIFIEPVSQEVDANTGEDAPELAVSKTPTGTPSKGSPAKGRGRGSGAVGKDCVAKKHSWWSRQPANYVGTPRPGMRVAPKYSSNPASRPHGPGRGAAAERHAFGRGGCQVGTYYKGCGRGKPHARPDTGYSASKHREILAHENELRQSPSQGDMAAGPDPHHSATAHIDPGGLAGSTAEHGRQSIQPMQSSPTFTGRQSHSKVAANTSPQGGRCSVTPSDNSVGSFSIFEGASDLDASSPFRREMGSETHVDKLSRIGSGIIKMGSMLLLPGQTSEKRLLARKENSQRRAKQRQRQAERDANLALEALADSSLGKQSTLMAVAASDISGSEVDEYSGAELDADDSSVYSSASPSTSVSRSCSQDASHDSVEERSTSSRRSARWSMTPSRPSTVLRELSPSVFVAERSRPRTRKKSQYRGRDLKKITQEWVKYEAQQRAAIQHRDMSLSGRSASPCSAEDFLLTGPHRVRPGSIDPVPERFNNFNDVGRRLTSFSPITRRRYPSQPSLQSSFNEVIVGCEKHVCKNIQDDPMLADIMQGSAGVPSRCMMVKGKMYRGTPAGTPRGDCAGLSPSKAPRNYLKYPPLSARKFASDEVWGSLNLTSSPRQARSTSRLEDEFCEHAGAAAASWKPKTERLKQMAPAMPRSESAPPERPSRTPAYTPWSQSNAHQVIFGKQGDAAPIDASTFKGCAGRCHWSLSPERPKVGRVAPMVDQCKVGEVRAGHVPAGHPVFARRDMYRRDVRSRADEAGISKHFGPDSFQSIFGGAMSDKMSSQNSVTGKII